MITQNTTIQYNPQWRNLNQQEIYLEVDTTNQAIVIFLPEIASMGGFYNVKFYITDTNGNSATNNIFIAPQGSDLIDSSTSINISTNYGSVLIACNGSSWIALESSNIPPATPAKVGLIAASRLSMETTEPQILVNYCTQSIITDVVLFYAIGTVASTFAGEIIDGNLNTIARITFISETELGLQFSGNYINKDTLYTKDNMQAVNITNVVQQSVRTAPFYFQSEGSDVGVYVDVKVYGYNLD